MRLEQTVKDFLRTRNLLSKDFRISKKLRSALVELSSVFTRERAELPKGYFKNQLHRDAYVAGFVLTNAAKVRRCLAHHLDLLPSEGGLSILDIGSGPGTAVFAASELLAKHCPDQEVRFVAVESNREILGVARELSKEVLPKHHHVEWIVGDIKNLSRATEGKHFDLAIAANVLSEVQAATKICQNILVKSKSLIIIDPALKKTTRDLMALRDELIENGDAYVVAPCLHQKPCPMLAANDRDWCHFYIEWQRPPLIAALDSATGLDHRYLKMGYLVVCGSRGIACHSDRPSASEEARDPSASLGMTNETRYRLVSSPLKSKGKTELILCGEDSELRRIRRLDRHASEANADMDTVKRGDVVRLNEAPTIEVGADDFFQIVERFTIV